MMIDRFRQCACVSLILAILSALAATDGRAAVICNTVQQPIEVSATTLSFGNYSPGPASPTDANSIVKVYCNNASDHLPSFTVALSAGVAGGFNPRKMKNGSTALNYNMYTTSGYTTIWGDGTSGTSTQSYSQSQNLNAKSFTDYGQVPPSQFVTAGSYADTITVTVTY